MAFVVTCYFYVASILLSNGVESKHESWNIWGDSGGVGFSLSETKQGFQYTWREILSGLSLDHVPVD